VKKLKVSNLNKNALNIVAQYLNMLRFQDFYKEI